MKKHLIQKILVIGMVQMIIFCFSGMVLADGSPKPGERIDKNNIEQYKHLFPEEFIEAFTTGWDLIEPLSIEIQETITNTPPKEFMALSEKNKGKYTIDSEGYITGGPWQDIVGYPFPDIDPSTPEFATKLMWNFDYRYTMDDGYATMTQLDKRLGEKVGITIAETAILMLQGRMFDEPTPLYETSTGLRKGHYIRYLAPAIQRNFILLMYRYLDQKEPDTTFMYLPSMRRVLRGEAGQRSTPVQSSTQAPDDFDCGFNGRIPEFTYKLVGEKKIIAQTNATLGHENFGKNLKKLDLIPMDPNGWQIRDVYIIDIIPKDPKYPQQYKRFYLDKESMIGLYAIGYDRSGKAWKVWQTPVAPTPNGYGDTTPYMKGLFCVDIQLKYTSTLFMDWAINKQGLKESDFTISALRRMGK